MNRRAQVPPSLVGSLQGARESNSPVARAAAIMSWAALSRSLASTEETICASLTVKPSFWVASGGNPATDDRASTPRSRATEAAYSALLRRRTRAGSSGLSDGVPGPSVPAPPPSAGVRPPAITSGLPRQPASAAPAKIRASTRQPSLSLTVSRRFRRLRRSSGSARATPSQARGPCGGELPARHPQPPSPLPALTLTHWPPAPHRPSDPHSPAQQTPP